MTAPPKPGDAWYTDRRTDWMEAARCAQSDPELWFPGTGDYIASQRARAICFTCPVKTECREYALAEEIPFGIWGGLTADQRGAMLRRGRYDSPMCSEGHLLDAGNLYIAPDGGKRCRTCRRNWDSRRRLKVAAS